MVQTNELLTPIPGENPAGDDLRYDPLYDRIKEARREELDIPSGDWSASRKTADWPLVIKLTSEGLATRSKDVHLAVWLTEALLRSEGLGGLRQGLGLVRSLLVEFWEQIYPELEDGDASLRAAPLSWLGLKLDVAVKMAPITDAGHSYIEYLDSQKVPTEEEAEADYEGSKKESRQRAIDEGKTPPEVFQQAFRATSKASYRQLAEDVDACRELIADLEVIGDERFGDEAPSFRVLKGAVDEVGRTIQQFLARKLEAEPDPVDANAAGAVPAAGPATSDDDAMRTGAAERTPAGRQVAAAAAPVTDHDDAAARIAAAARYLRQERPTSPAPYLILRGFRWGELRETGGRIDPRLLDAPTTEARVRLKSLLLDRDWESLLEAAEEVMASPSGRGWLDLQRYVSTACTALGGEYAAVGDAIRLSLRQLLRELPELSAITLMDDTATANAETLAWLSQEVIPAEGAEDDAAPPTYPVVPPVAADTDFMLRAMARVRSGQPEKGIELLLQEALRAGSPRAGFLRRTEACRIMVDSGQEAVALPILRQLIEQVNETIEQWESPETVAQPLGVMYRCLEKLGEDEAARQELYQRICTLDPLLAMSLGSRPAGPRLESSETEESASWE